MKSGIECAVIYLLQSELISAGGTLCGRNLFIESNNLNAVKLYIDVDIYDL